MKVFISYAHSDSDSKEKLLKNFQKVLPTLSPDQSPKVFLDSSAVTLGDDIREKIRDAIQECSVCVVLWTPQAAASDWVQYELAMADALEKRILFVKEATAPEVPQSLKEHEVIRLKE
jgi:sugar-specific transcriptional regulator TrmB